jgi:hypothetical protein
MSRVYIGSQAICVLTERSRELDLVRDTFNCVLVRVNIVKCV